MLKHGTAYADLGPDHFDRRAKEVQARRLVRRLAELGYAVELAPQGNRVNIRSRGLSDEGLEVGGVPAGALAAALQADGWSRLMQQVRGHVSDHGHVRGAMAGPEPGEIIAEDDIQDPV